MGIYGNDWGLMGINRDLLSSEGLGWNVLLAGAPNFQAFLTSTCNGYQQITAVCDFLDRNVTHPHF
jgi:hypothetical protein